MRQIGFDLLRHEFETPLDSSQTLIDPIHTAADSGEHEFHRHVTTLDHLQPRPQIREIRQNTVELFVEKP
jgi:hypothetical protein